LENKSLETFVARKYRARRSSDNGEPSRQKHGFKDYTCRKWSRPDDLTKEQGESRREL
jgi:hypothetical protein